MSAAGEGRIAFDCIGFDLDGTLLHTGRELAVSLNHALMGNGYRTVATEDAIRMIGGGARAMLVRALASLGERDLVAIDRLFPDMIEHYSAHLGGDTDIYPGLVPLLDRLSESGVQLAVVTNKNEDLSRRLIEAKGLAGYFDLLVGGDTLGPDSKKPKPDMLRFMLRSINSRNALFIGDSEYDAGAAKAANMPFVAVEFGYATEDLRSLGAAHVIGHYDALWPLLENWR